MQDSGDATKVHRVTTQVVPSYPPNWPPFSPPSTAIADVSDVTLLNRLRQAEGWLRQLCQRLWKENGVDLEPALKGRPVRLVDATIVREPGKTGGQWRVHYSMRLPSLECDYFDLTSVEGENTGEKLGRFALQAGELVLADAAYCNPPGVAAAVGQGADVCMRLSRLSLPLVDENGGPFPLMKKIKSLRRAGEAGDWWVRSVDSKEAGREDQPRNRSSLRGRRVQSSGRQHLAATAICEVGPTRRGP